MLSSYWLGMHVGTTAWVIISQNPLILLFLKNQWPLTKRDEKTLACGIKPMYHDCVLIQLKGLGTSLIYVSTMFKAQPKLFLLKNFCKWRLLSPECPSLLVHSDLAVTLTSYLKPLGAVLAAHWLIWGASGHADAWLHPRDSHAVGTGVCWDVSRTLRFVEAQMLLRWRQVLRITVYSTCAYLWPRWSLCPLQLE